MVPGTNEKLLCRLVVDNDMDGEWERMVMGFLIWLGLLRRGEGAVGRQGRLEQRKVSLFSSSRPFSQEVSNERHTKLGLVTQF